MAWDNDEDREERKEWRMDPLTETIGRVKSLEKRAENFITSDEFRPVRVLVYGLTGIILTTVIGAILAKVVMK